MKIHGHAGDDLLQRMQEAHERQRVEGGTVGGMAADRTEGARPADAIEPPESTARALDARVRDIANRALAGEFATSGEVREAVIGEIVDERFGEGLDLSTRRDMTRVLRDALADDPEFGRQVDDMLVMAASDLGG